MLSVERFSLKVKTEFQNTTPFNFLDTWHVVGMLGREHISGCQNRSFVDLSFLSGPSWGSVPCSDGMVTSRDLLFMSASPVDVLHGLL